MSPELALTELRLALQMLLLLAGPPLLAVLGFGGAWFIGQIVDYTSGLILRIPQLVMG